jgi:hypothetical protein
LAECVGDVRALLRQILSDSVPSVNITRKTSKSRSLKSEYNHLHLLRSVRNVMDTHVAPACCGAKVLLLFLDHMEMKVTLCCVCHEGIQEE